MFIIAAIFRQKTPDHITEHNIVNTNVIYQMYSGIAEHFLQRSFIHAGVSWQFMSISFEYYLRNAEYFTHVRNFVKMSPSTLRLSSRGSISEHESSADVVHEAAVPIHVVVCRHQASETRENCYRLDHRGAKHTICAVTDDDLHSKQLP